MNVNPLVEALAHAGTSTQRLAVNIKLDGHTVRDGNGAPDDATAATRLADALYTDRYVMSATNDREMLKFRDAPPMLKDAARNRLAWLSNVQRSLVTAPRAVFVELVDGLADGNGPALAVAMERGVQDAIHAFRDSLRHPLTGEKAA